MCVPLLMPVVCLPSSLVRTKLTVVLEKVSVLEDKLSYVAMSRLPSLPAPVYCVCVCVAQRLEV